MNQSLGIVLYNPDEIFLNNLILYIKLFRNIYINDNSDKINTTIKEYSTKFNIKYTYNNDNLGIAKSLNLICSEAIHDDNKYILLLDQDSKIIDFSYIELLNNNNILINSNVGLISLSFFESLDSKELFNKQIALTSGSIINLEIWSKVLGFEEKLFIDEVDHDYCLKLLNNNFFILGTKKKYLEHQVGFINAHHFLKLKLLSVSCHHPLRTYYCFRNSNYIIFKYFSKNTSFAFNRLFNLLKELYFIFFVYTEKRQHLYFMFYGIFDFIRSKYGKFNQ